MRRTSCGEADGNSGTVVEPEETLSGGGASHLCLEVCRQVPNDVNALIYCEFAYPYTNCHHEAERTFIANLASLVLAQAAVFRRAGCPASLRADAVCRSKK